MKWYISFDIWPVGFVSDIIAKYCEKKKKKTMVKHKGTDFTREEQLLLQDFSQNVSTKSSALFYGNAFIISAIPGGYVTSCH